LALFFRWQYSHYLPPAAFHTIASVIGAWAQGERKALARLATPWRFAKIHLTMGDVDRVLVWSEECCKNGRTASHASQSEIHEVEFGRIPTDKV
jgi:hypothetical protein